MKNRTRYIKWIFVFSLVVICSFGQNIWVQAHTLAVHSENIKAVPAGVQEDSTYAFTFHADADADCEVWGYSGTVMTMDKSDPEYGGDMERTIVMPTDNGLSGNMGFWLYNMGNYQGKKIDVKCTFYWTPLVLDGIAINPYIVESHGKRKIWFHFRNRSYEVKYELYSDGEPIFVNMNLMTLDIDKTQYMGIKVEDGAIHQMECREDSTLYYKQQEGYHWFYSDPQKSSNELSSAVRIELQDTHSFRIVYGHGEDLWSYPLERFYKDSEENLKAIVIEKQNSALPQVQNMNKAYFADDIGSGALFMAKSFGYTDIPEPVLYGRDIDEVSYKSHNAKTGEIITYDVYQQIPGEVEDYYYTQWELSGTIPQGMEYVSSEVYDCDGDNVTESFIVNVVGSDISIRCRNTLDGNFYNNNFHWRVNVRIKEECREESMDSVFQCKVIRFGTETITTSNGVTTFLEKEKQIKQIYINGKLHEIEL